MKQKHCQLRRISSGRNIFLGLLLLVGLVLTLALSSCNVTRTITTQSQYYQKGDTTCTIVTKTIEQYDATKKLY